MQPPWVGKYAEGSAEFDAMRLLASRLAKPKEIIRIEIDRILFVTTENEAKTGFVTSECVDEEKGKRTVRLDVVSGFPA